MNITDEIKNAVKLMPGHIGRLQTAYIESELVTELSLDNFSLGVEMLATLLEECQRGMITEHFLFDWDCGYVTVAPKSAKGKLACMLSRKLDIPLTVEHNGGNTE